MAGASSLHLSLVAAVAEAVGGVAGGNLVEHRQPRAPLRLLGACPQRTQKLLDLREYDLERVEVRAGRRQ